MSLVILFHFLCAQYVSVINIYIIRSLRLFCWITTLVVLFLVRCVLEFRCGWFGVVSVLLAVASACNTGTTPNQPHWNSNTHRTKNNTTNVVIQQNSRKLLMMDILMSETCWAYKKWNKIASDIKLVFYSSTRLILFTYNFEVLHPVQFHILDVFPITRTKWTFLLITSLYHLPSDVSVCLTQSSGRIYVLLIQKIRRLVLK